MSNANRNFTAQSKGIVTASFDFLEYGDNNKIGSAEFILRGTNADNELKEMIKVIAERDQTFKIGDKSIGDLVLDMDVWYNVSIELNFFTGRQRFLYILIRSMTAQKENILYLKMELRPRLILINLIYWRRNTLC